jgi:hypothetical protein
MPKSKIASLFLISGLVVLAAGFDCGGVPAPQPGGITGGFPVETRSVLVDSLGNPITSPIAAPGIAVSGVWLSDAESRAAGSVTQFALATDSNGNGFVTNGRVFANWSSQVLWEPPCGEQTSDTLPFLDVQPITGIGWECETIVVVEESALSTHFALPNQLPSTITAYGSGFSKTYGWPQMKAFSDSSVATTVTATSVASDGSSATFPFPTASGVALPMGFYALQLSNAGSAGNRLWQGTNYLAMGGNNTSFTTPFGVDVADLTTIVRICVGGEPETVPKTAEPAYQLPPCTPQVITTKASIPVVTQYSTNQLSYRGHLISVGVNPTAVAAYANTITVSGDVTTIGPSRAAVVNTGSNSVTIANLTTYAPLATILVGAQPVTIRVKGDNSVAWVADYGDGTVKEINLSSFTTSRSATVGTNPASLAYDSTNNVLWVGGLNYIAKLDLTSFTVVSTIPVSGVVTSLGLSAGRGELVSTVVTGGASVPYEAAGYTQSSNVAIKEFQLSSGAATASYSNIGAADIYKSYAMSGTTPNVSLLPNGTVVSANYSNSLSVSATPTGFTVVDLVTHQPIMQGTTPTPVRCIGVDQTQAIAYLTVPDSNLLITVPLQ